MISIFLLRLISITSLHNYFQCFFNNKNVSNNRSESGKKEKVKRTLSLKTRRHTQSFKDKYKMPSEMPPSEMEGMLERKQELQGGGKKATIRSWKNYYTVLCGQLLCFFKDRHGN